MSKSKQWFVGTFTSLALLTVGCGHAAVAGPGMNGPRGNNFARAASRELSCDPSALELQFVQSIEPNAHVYRASGCGGVYESILHCIGMCTWNPLPHRRASFELQCPPPQVSWSYLGDATVGFTGLRPNDHLPVRQRSRGGELRDARRLLT